ncbi:hypothetical protein RN001_009452 [Aquatica leii]|uniref:Exonuclease domain-containing protein n=1 Tax=Aquatica leii TaxID=1421715 RepID=A0AAN7S861_9COLE|nr:hypothetical protein RN001_009452 [Aquatica leii]
MHKEPKTSSSKSKTRYEKKCKKTAAYLLVSKLNEDDRNKKTILPELVSIDSEPSPKRICIESTEIFPCIKNYSQEPFKMKPKLKLKLKDVGVAASLQTDREERMPLFLSDIQHLLLFSQLGHLSPYAPTRWCQLEKYHQLTCTTVLVVENVSLYHYLSYESLFTSLSKCPHKFEVITPGAYKVDIVQDLATVPLTVPQMIKLMSEYGSLEKAALQSPNVFDRIKGLFPVELEDALVPTSSLPPTDKFPRTQLLLSGWQMVEENYPLPIKGLMENKYAGYVLTKDCYKDVTPFSPMFGIDCEMCMTTIELELTRVSVVDESGEVIYEELVKPKMPIRDYLTEYSGITPKMMKDVSKTLHDVQEDLRQILPADAILVGQSLSNDMHALKMMHPYIIDTSVIYNTSGHRNRKTKLQLLAQQFLKKKIQTNRKGHCSVEDSLASLNLAKEKLKHDITYGDAVMKNVSLQVKHYYSLGNSNYATSLLQEITRMENTALVVSLEDIITRYFHYTYKDTNLLSRKINCLLEDDNELVVNKLCENIPNYSFNIGHVRFQDSELENDPTTLFVKINNWVEEIVGSAQTPAMHVVIFGGQRESGNGCCFICLKKCP